MEYILQNLWQLAIALFIGSAFGWIAYALLINADISGLILENQLLSGSLREKEKEIEVLQREHLYLEELLREKKDETSNN